MRLIFEFLKSLPAIVTLIFELKRLIDQALEVQERKRKAEEMARAIKKARETGDTSDIENILSTLNLK